MTDLAPKLKLAIEDTDTDSVKKLLSLGVDPNTVFTQRSLFGSSKEKIPALIYTMNHWENDEIIDELLRSGADPNLPDSDGRTPLMKVRFGKNAENLLKYGANPSAILNGKTVLDFLLDSHSTPGAIKILLETGAVSSKSDRNDLLLASRSGDLDYVKNLLENDSTLTDEDIYIAMKIAGVNHHLDVIEELFNSNHAIYFNDLIDYFYEGYLGEYKDVTKWLLILGDEWELDSQKLEVTPLMRAAIIEDLDELRELIENKVDINKNIGADTALSMAAIFDSPESAKYLIKHGANVNFHIGHGHTPLLYAAHDGNSKIIKILLDAGANPNDVDYEGDPALRLILTNKYDLSPEELDARYETAHALLSAGADPNLNDAWMSHLCDERMVRLLLLYEANPYSYYRKEKSVIDYAKEKNPEMVPLLLAYRDDPNQADSKGVTNLMKKVKDGIISVVKYYLMKKPDIDLRDDEGNTALHYAVLDNRRNMVDLLLRDGADPLIKNKMGYLPINYSNDNEIMYSLQRAMAARESLERSSAVIYQPGSRWVGPLMTTWKRDIKYRKITPGYRLAIENDCQNSTKTRDEILSLADSLGLSRDQLHELSKKEICSIMIKHLEIIEGDRFVPI